MNTKKAELSQADIYVIESRRYKNTRSQSAYEHYKRKLRELNLEPEDYEKSIWVISKTIGV